MDIEREEERVEIRKRCQIQLMILNNFTYLELDFCFLEKISSVEVILLSLRNENIFTPLFVLSTDRWIPVC